MTLFFYSSRHPRLLINLSVKNPLIKFRFQTRYPLTDDNNDPVDAYISSDDQILINPKEDTIILSITVRPTCNIRAISKSKKPHQDKKSNKDLKSSTDSKDILGPKTEVVKILPKVNRKDKF